MIKLAHIITDTNIGGAGRLLLNQLGRFNREVLDISVVLPRGSELVPKIIALGYPVIECARGADRSFELRAIPEYTAIIRSLNPDIVHCHGAFSARIASLLASVPVRIYTRHCAYRPPAYLRRFPIRQLCGGVNRLLSNGIVAVAEAAADDLTATGTPRERISVIINGVEPLVRISDEERRRVRGELGFEDNDFVAGIFARLEECKGHMYLLRALAMTAGGGEGCAPASEANAVAAPRGPVPFGGEGAEPHEGVSPAPDAPHNLGSINSASVASPGCEKIGAAPFVSPDGENPSAAPEASSHCENMSFARGCAAQWEAVRPIKLLICGKGRLDSELRAEAEGLGIAGRVVFAGFIDDIAPYMNAVDVNINCSVGTETSSLALSEGMSIGKPAIVSDYGGNPFMIEDGVSGIVLPAADSRALTDALVSLAGDRERLSAMSGAAVARYRRYFSADTMTKRLEELYLGLYNKYVSKVGKRVTF